ARVSGDEQFDETGHNSTIGAVRKPSPMDSFLDWIASLRGRDRKVERDAKKNATLTARSSEAPVIAQRPIAPLQPIKSEEKRHVPMEMVSVTDTGAESVIIDEETNEVSAPVNRGLSIEEMAYGTSSRKASSTQARSGFAPQPTCRVCSAPNPVGERFCSNCGSDL
ncbi:MAG: zinc ribbon domain-containing protein, partial [Candidatus Poseidoniaceae archaeon]